MIQVARGQNRHANSLATLASLLTKEVPRLIKVELVAEPSINTGVGVLVVAISNPFGWTQSLTFWPRIEC